MENQGRLFVLVTTTSFFVFYFGVIPPVVHSQTSHHNHHNHAHGHRMKIPHSHKEHGHVHNHNEHHLNHRNKGPPNIIYILADDAGWNDFSFHGSAQIPTPNIDALALNGIVLNSYYVSPLCTPTRGSIMTGKYPIHLGLQHYVVRGATAGGLPLQEKLLPTYLKEFGYATHLVGKWHLGHSKKEFLPTERGFDSHFGYWLGKQDYYSHISMDGKDNEGNWCWGYDFRSNYSVQRNVFGSYGTDILTTEAIRLIESHSQNTPLFLMLNHMAPHSANFYEPLQAPAENIQKFSETIQDENRRIYAAMVDKVDESVGKVVNALANRGLLSNSIIVFASDNGAAPDGYDLNYGSNWPLRGIKNTLWEGGTRVSAMIWSPLIQARVSQDLMHAADWVPTLYEAAGGDPNHLQGLDGISLWNTFTHRTKSPRESVLYNIDGPYNNSAIREGPWKLIQGKSPTSDLGQGDWNFWHGETGQTSGNSSQLLPQIINSVTAKALLKSGFRLNATIMEQLQKEAQVFCNRQQEDIPPCDLSQAPCLFHLEDDPCELWNVADREPEQVKRLLDMISELNKTALPPMSRLRHPEGFPRNWGNIWTTWEDNLETKLQSAKRSSGSNEISSTELIFIMLLVILILIK